MAEEKTMDELYMQIRAFQKTMNDDQMKPKLKAMGFTLAQIQKAFDTLQNRNKRSHKNNTILEEIEKFQLGSGQETAKKKKEIINPNLKAMETRYQKISQMIMKLSRKGHDTSLVHLKLLHSYTDLVYLRSYYEDRIHKNMQHKIIEIENEIHQINRFK
jgi:DNA-binding transcriptional MerR regulator